MLLLLIEQGKLSLVLPTRPQTLLTTRDHPKQTGSIRNPTACDYKRPRHKKQGRELGENWREAIRLKPNYADAHLNLGITLANAGHVAEAINELETANRLQPDPAVQQEINHLRR